MPSITPYKIAISADKLNRLQQKLALTDFPSETSNSEQPWSRGAPLSDIKRLVRYWGNEFDWRKIEVELNKLPQYITKIDVDGLDTYDVHFVHQRSTTSNAIPLLFLHGWPGSFLEVSKLLPQLNQGGKDSPAFHIVAPSLIDFGFSGASRKSGFNIDQHAETYHKLMQSLGYNEYVVQGGDLGFLIARFLAAKYGPTSVKAHHINTAAPAQPTVETYPELYTKVQASELSSAELVGLQRSEWFSKEGNGYFRQQSTKPQTIGYSLTDSPVGLLSWIYEKLHDWSDNYPWTDDEILTWVSIYYFSTAGPSATACIYYEMEHRETPVFTAIQAYTNVPTGIARFPKDLILLPKLWNHTLGPIVFESEHESGGHFASWERPDAIVKDLRTMFGKDGGAYSCVSGKNGYEY